MGDPPTRSPAVNTLLILGGHGDLATRYLLPAAAELIDAGLFPARLRIVAVDRAEIDTADYRDHVVAELRQHAPHLPERTRAELCSRLDYRPGSATEAGDLRAAVAGLDGAIAVYLALPNAVFHDTIASLGEVGLPPGSRLVVEKPFGVDQADAQQLNALIRQEFSEDHVFRIDHVLGEQIVLDVLGLRFGNRLFESAWTAEHIESVDIVFDETIALEGRAGYYDHAGALRDMIQNHLLQMLAVVAMEPPTELNERELRDRKADVLRAVRPPEPARMREASRRARYSAGRSPDGSAVPAYVDEPDVDADRATETYAEVTFSIHNVRWAGVPFRLRTGKALGADRREIVVRFRPPNHQPFDNRGAVEQLRFTMGPDSIRFDVNLNGAGDPAELQSQAFVADVGEQRLPSYSRLLREVVAGDTTLSVRGDEAEECWRIVEPVLAAWTAGEVPLEEYPAGSDGPGAR